MALLVHYGFEMGGYKAEELVAKWLNDYQANWVRLGVIEALYQGRYKSVSVEQILASWSRRSRAVYHFNHEFERLICRKFPQNLADSLTNQAAPEFPQELEILDIPDCDQMTSHCSDGHVETNTPNCSIQESERNQKTDVSTQSAAEMHASSVSLVTPITSPTSSSPSLVAPGSTPFNPDDVRTEHLRDADETREAKEQQSNSYKVNYEADWSRWDAAKRPINQFTPPPDISDFYLKLKAVALLREDLTE